MQNETRLSVERRQPQEFKLVQKLNKEFYIDMKGEGKPELNDFSGDDLSNLYQKDLKSFIGLRNAQINVMNRRECVNYDL